MWLIDTATIRLHFIEDPTGYKYAILSHTWEGGEVSFQEIANLEEARKKPGFGKIQKTCELARARGLQYAWVDTCCIDKTSSAELTEAINSMYQWYKLSTVCFAYLSDLPDQEIHNSYDLIFFLHGCRWFARGWTLQELIAPRFIEFYGKTWTMHGDKISLQYELSDFTGIDEAILADSEVVSMASVAKRLSWASSRQTTRIEDMAYCLFGLFDVHLPLIYGEGSKAFIRLQEAIILESSDLSIFAWKSDFKDQAIRGILAFSPSEFRQCGDIQRVDDPLIISPDFVITNKGVKIETCLTKGDGDYLMSLQCTDAKKRESGGSSEVLAIKLLKTAHGYVRHKSIHLAAAPDVQMQAPQYSSEYKKISVCIPKTISLIEAQLLHARLMHRFAVKTNNTSPYWDRVTIQPQHLWDEGTNSFITEHNDKFAGKVEITLKPKRTKFRQHSLNILVYLGLVNESDVMKPWAGIYQYHFSHGLLYEDSNSKKVILGSDFSSLADMRKYLCLSATKQSLPKFLTPILLVKREVTLPLVHVSLLLSRDTESPDARYKLVIEISGEEDEHKGF